MQKFEDKDRVLIVGLPKSGTTILTYRVADCYPNSKIFFEPGKTQSLTDASIHENIYSNPKPSIITKCLFVPTEPTNLEEIQKYYDKRIWIFRDPRDWVISSYLYKWRQLNEQNVDNIIKNIRRKEDNPSKYPFFRLLPKKFPEKLKNAYGEMTQHLMSLDDNWHRLKYEDFVDDKLEGLNTYLEKNIDPSVEVDQKYSRVKRSTAYGNWRKWFNEEDIEYFKELLNPFLSILEYDIDDWETQLPEQLDPALGSEYLLNLYTLKRNEAH